MGSQTKIYICGLGPGHERYITKETKDHLDSATNIFVRTKSHPCAPIVGEAKSFDPLYEAAATFEEVYEQITSTLLDEAQVSDVTYVVPGSPLVLETSVQQLLRQSEVPVEVLPAMSFLDVTWERLKIDPVTSGVKLVDGQMFDAEIVGEQGPLLVAQVFSKFLLSEIKLAFDQEQPESVVVLQRLGSDDEEIREISWSELDRSVEPDYLTSLYIPKLPTKTKHPLERNIDLIHKLRNECPWDKEQTHKSLKKHLLEECNEVAEAIDNLNEAEQVGYVELEEELADVWLQILLHCELASESAQFTVLEMAETLEEKMIRRHPHVFGDSKANTLEELEKQWDEIKREEKKSKS